MRGESIPAFVTLMDVRLRVALLSEPDVMVILSELAAWLETLAMSASILRTPDPARLPKVRVLY